MSGWRKFGVRKVTTLAVAALSLSFANMSNTAPDAPGALTARTPVLAADTVSFIQKLATQPELMHPNYLRYVIGAPENERSQYALKTKNYYWYEGPRRHNAFQLHHDGPSPGVITRSDFSLNLLKSQLTYKEMTKIFGQPHKRVFDRQSYPTDVYQTGPYTHVAFTQPHDTFRVERVQICYDGPPLPPPPQEEILMAYNAGRTKALQMASKGDIRQAIPWLEKDVRLNPYDANAHAQLAAAYRSNLMINEAISEYATALKLAGDENTANSCRNALVEMKVLAPPPPQTKQQMQNPRNYFAQSGAAGL